MNVSCGHDFIAYNKNSLPIEIFGRVKWTALELASRLMLLAAGANKFLRQTTRETAGDLIYDFHSVTQF